MSTDHIVGAVSAYFGAFTAQLLVNARVRRFVKNHLDGIYRRLGRIEVELKLTSEAVPDTDLQPRRISGVWPAK